jgi:hypothetical protein
MKNQKAINLLNQWLKEPLCDEERDSWNKIKNKKYMKKISKSQSPFANFIYESKDISIYFDYCDIVDGTLSFSLSPEGWQINHEAHVWVQIGDNLTQSDAEDIVSFCEDKNYEVLELK